MANIRLKKACFHILNSNPMFATFDGNVWKKLNPPH